MTGLRIGFIGGGRIVRIILGGWEKAGILPLLDVNVSDSSEETLRNLKLRFPRVNTLTRGNREAAWADIVFLALQPPDADEALTEIRPTLQDNALVVSLMPKIRITDLSDSLGGFRRIVRMIPNAPSIIGQGYNPVSFSPGITDKDRSSLLPLFAALGESPQVLEEHLEAYAVITAMGPTYFWFQLEELANLAQMFGLSEQAARNGVEHMARGAVQTLFSSGMSPEEVMDLVPVKPIGEEEPAIKAMYLGKLTALHNMLRG